MSLLTPEDLSAIAADMRACGVTELELRLPGGGRLKLRGDRPLPAPEPAAVPAMPDPIAASGAGHLLYTHPARTAPAALPGETVKAGQIVAWLQIESLLCPVTAPAAGTLGERCAEDGTLLGYGSPVFGFTPTDG